MLRAEVLAEAQQLLHGDREKDYGPPSESLGRIAALWGAYLSVPLQPGDVAAMMVLLKLSRVRHCLSNADSWVDIAGYAACGSEVSQVQS